MLPDLVQFRDDYKEQMTVESFNLSTDPSAAGDLPVSMIPTQFIYNSDGTPYRPQTFTIGNSFELITNNAGDHILTKHVGSLFYEDLVSIYNDIAGQ